MPLRNVWECDDYFNHKVQGSWDERSAALSEHIEHFRYLLIFKGVVFFQAELDKTWPADVYCGRFLDSALLRRLSAESKKPLMHYRFESSGYIDIVFSSFSIRKIKGRIAYGLKDDCSYSACLPPHGIAEYALDHDSERLERLLAAQREGDTASLLRLTRESLSLVAGDEQACFYAAWLLGFLGDASDLPALLSLFLSIDAHMAKHSLPINGRLPKREVLDAIERIQLCAEGIRH